MGKGVNKIRCKGKIYGIQDNRVPKIQEEDEGKVLKVGEGAIVFGENIEAALNAKQDTLVSGENLKTFAGVSLLDDGDIFTVPIQWEGTGKFYGSTFVFSPKSGNGGKITFTAGTPGTIAEADYMGFHSIGSFRGTIYKTTLGYDHIQHDKSSDGGSTYVHSYLSYPVNKSGTLALTSDIDDAKDIELIQFLWDNAYNSTIPVDDITGFTSISTVSDLNTKFGLNLGEDLHQNLYLLAYVYTDIVEPYGTKALLYGLYGAINGTSVSIASIESPNTYVASLEKICLCEENIYHFKRTEVYETGSVMADNPLVQLTYPLGDEERNAFPGERGKELEKKTTKTFYPWNAGMTTPVLTMSDLQAITTKSRFEHVFGVSPNNGINQCIAYVYDGSSTSAGPYIIYHARAVNIDFLVDGSSVTPPSSFPSDGLLNVDRIYINTRDNKLYWLEKPIHYHYDEMATETDVCPLVELSPTVLDIIETTWAELKALRDNGNLIPGTQYRITDYECTTTTTDTSSANHPFDIIVRADDVNKLNEVASAIQHKPSASKWVYSITFTDGVTKNCYLMSYTPGKYNIIDCETLLGIENQRIIINDLSGTAPCASTDLNKNVEPYYFANNNLQAWQLWYCLDNDTNRFDWADSVNGKGVIYRMIDEFGNDCPYDFKNILFTKSGKYTNAYTFSYTEDNIIKDASLLGLDKQCYSNTIKEYTNQSKQELNFNVFYSTSATFNCYLTTLANNCSSNTCGYSCHSITFGRDCYSNTFGNICHSNIFGNNCLYNTFGNSCNSNNFANSCSSNTFGNSCSHNKFGNSCSSNTFGNSCSHNKFGNMGQSNTFGDSCSYNTFGIDCSNNKFGSIYSYNIFGDGCHYITFGDSSSAIKYCQYNIIDNGCKYLYITKGTGSDYLQNIHIHLGVKGSSSSNRKIIIVDKNLSYETDVYQDENGEIIYKKNNDEEECSYAETMEILSSVLMPEGTTVSNNNVTLPEGSTVTNHNVNL